MLYLLIKKRLSYICHESTLNDEMDEIIEEQYDKNKTANIPVIYDQEKFKNNQKFKFNLGNFYVILNFYLKFLVQNNTMTMQ